MNVIKTPNQHYLTEEFLQFESLGGLKEVVIRHYSDQSGSN